jgi:hypothetical protein
VLGIAVVVVAFSSVDSTTGGSGIDATAVGASLVDDVFGFFVVVSSLLLFFDDFFFPEPNGQD